MNPVIGWLIESSREQKRALLAACLGWMLDSMDVMLYALVLGPVQREMHLSAAMSGAMMSGTLISAAVGGILFGWYGDGDTPSRLPTTGMQIGMFVGAGMVLVGAGRLLMLFAARRRSAV